MTLRGRRLALALLSAGVAAAAVWLRCGPLPEGLLDPDPRVSTTILDRNGETLYEALSPQGARARPLDADHLPAALVDATLAAEDARFFHHFGLDPLAIARAALHDLRARRLREGGSTLTQQTVKILMARDRSLGGKLREMVLALRLEHQLDKRQILALYLSVAPYGNQRVGAEAASRAYFGCPAANLTPAQAALLAALPQRPGALNPYRNPAQALKRQEWVLDRMRGLGTLDATSLAAARAESLRIVQQGSDLVAPHFVERVRASLASPAREAETTLDLPLQRRVQGILRMHHERLLRHGAHAAAVAVLDNASGEWLAWEGSGDYFDDEHGGAIDGVVAPRQPGSALKPFTYALAFERGFTPASVLPDLPAHFATVEPGVSYTPRNYDGVFRGPLRARAALAGSENVPAVYVLSQVGVSDLLRLLRRSGFSTLDKTADHYGYALTMGDAEVRLEDLVAGYAGLARGGVYRQPRMIRRIQGAEGAWRAVEPARSQRIVSARAAFWIADVLADSRARSYIFGTGGSLDFPFRVAVKTGTSQSYHDNWTVGFTREVTVGVWVGNFDRTPLHDSSGVTGAAPLFHDVMLAAEERVLGRWPVETDPPLVDAPGGLVPVTICALSGLAATPACRTVETELLPVGEAPPACMWHRRSGPLSVVAWPAAYRAWARQQGVLVEGASLTSEEHRAPTRTAHALLRITNPSEGSIYLKDPTLRPGFQTLALRAVAAGETRQLEWAVDGRQVGTSAPERPLDWPLAIGEHHIAVTDDQGRRAEASIVVR